MQIFNTSGKIRTLLIAALLGLGTTAGLSACGDEGPMEEAGEEVDEAVDEAEEAVDEAGDAFEDD